MLFSMLVGCNAPADTPSTEESSKDVDSTDLPEDGSQEGTEEDLQTDATTEPESEEETSEDAGTTTNILDGKKIIFIGNSHTYYGKTVLEKKQSVLTQAARSNDQGYFYQICKKNGAEVNVTNWTFGKHTLRDLFVSCSANRGCDGLDHKSYLVDRNYDFVFIQQGTGGDPESFLQDVDLVIDFFREANPDVKFFFLVPRLIYVKNVAYLSSLKYLPQRGVEIIEWGALVDDIITGVTKVPDTVLTYNQNSFIVRKSSSDGYHPNMLTGYITAQMAYCAATDTSAVGQDYSFWNDSSLHSLFDEEKFIKNYYTYKNATTNFPEIFASESDMLKLQKLIDEYLE